MWGEANCCYKQPWGEAFVASNWRVDQTVHGSLPAKIDTQAHSEADFPQLSLQKVTDLADTVTASV